MQHNKASTKITITVRGGVVQDITNIPAGVQICVRDYDIENFTEEELEKTERDEDGHPFIASVWECTYSFYCVEDNTQTKRKEENPSCPVKKH